MSQSKPSFPLHILLLLSFLLTPTLTSAAVSGSSAFTEDPEFVWVLVKTEVNPTDAKTAFFGGGQDPEWFAEPRFEGKSLVYGISENLFEVYERKVDHGIEYADINLNVTFESPPAYLEPGEEVTLQATASHAGEVHEDGSPGVLQFQYRSRDIKIQPDAPFYYSPWSEGFDGTSTTYFSFTAPSVFGEGEEFQVSAGLWNAPPCHVVWTFRSQSAGSQESEVEAERDESPRDPSHSPEECQALRQEVDDNVGVMPVSGGIGVVIAQMGETQVSHCEGGEEQLAKGTMIRIGECIQTGPGGRVRVQMADRDEQRDAGPSVINIAANSEMCFSEFVFMADKPSGHFGFDLIKGTIRTFFKGWRGDSQVSVRTGVTICGLRGTDVMIAYQPERNFSGLLIQEGIVDVTHRATGDTTTLTAGEMIAADESSLFGQGTITEEEWENLLEEKGIAESSTDPAYYPKALHEVEDEEVYTPSEAENGSSDEEIFADQGDPQDRDGFPLTLEGIFDSRWALLGGGCLVCGGGLTGILLLVGLVIWLRKRKGEEA